MKKLIFLVFSVCVIFSFNIAQRWVDEQNLNLQRANKQIKDDINKLNRVKETDIWVKEKILYRLKKIKSKDEAESALISFLDRYQNSFDLKIEEFIQDNKWFLSMKVKATVPREDIEKLKQLLNLSIDGGFIYCDTVTMDKKNVTVKIKLIYPFKEA